MSNHKDTTRSHASRHYPDKRFRNAPVRKAGKHRAARGTHTVSIKKATFEQIKEILLERVGSPDMPAASSVPNMVSALGSFISHYGFGWSDRVGDLLRRNYARARDEYALRLTELGHRKSYVKNRKALLNAWHRFCLALDYEGCSVTGDLNPFQEALQRTIGSERSLRSVAREIGVSHSALSSWVNRGSIPRTRQLDGVARLELLYDLSPGTLLSLIPRYRNKHAIKPRPPIAYRAKLREWSVQPYKLKPASLPANHPLREEWQSLVRYKVTGTCAAAAGLRGGSVLSRALQSGKPKTWDTRPLREHWKTESTRAKMWPEIIDDLWVPTANRTFNAAAEFLGWSMLRLQEGGAGYALEQVTLGMLANRELLLSFLDWRADRSGKINGGHTYFVDTALCLLHPKDGFLRKSAHIGGKLGFASDAWERHCDETYEWLAAEMRPTLTVAFKQAGASRDPSAPIAHILDLERPIDAVVRMLNRMDADRPTTGGAHEAVWARDMALLALMTSNPLRLINFVLMTYRPDNTGYLRQTANGQWRIVIGKDAIKNTRGGSKLGPYDQAVDPAVVPYVVRYLRTYRPAIGGPRPELVFVSTDNPDREFDGLDKVVRERTRTYLEGVDGIGPHAFRHIVATHLVKTTNGNLTLAAMALHDSHKTVERSYKHLLPSYVDAGRHEAFGASLKSLKGCRIRAQSQTESAAQIEA